MDTEVMDFTPSNFWSIDGEGSPDDTNLYSTAMDYPHEDIVDEVANFSAPPSMTPDRSTGTDSTGISNPYFQYSNQLQLSNNYPSALPYGYSYPGHGSPIVKLDPSVQHIIQDGNDNFSLEPLSYDHEPDDPMSMISSSANFHIPQGQHEPIPYHASTSPATWSNIPTPSWLVESKNVSFNPGQDATSLSKTSSTVQGRLDGDGKFKCNICEGLKTFSRPADLKRHMEAIHSTITYSCGCCDDKHPKPTFNRKDKLLKHKRRVHGYPIESDGSSLLTCNHRDCSNCTDTVFFCTAQNLHRHKVHAHGCLEVIGSSTSSNTNLIRNPNTLSSHLENVPNTAIPEHVSSTAKRHHSEEPADIPKRPKVERMDIDKSETLHATKPHISNERNVPLDYDSHSTEKSNTKDSGLLELSASSSSSSDLLLISQLISGPGPRSDSLQALISQLEKFDISFNLAERSIKVQGSNYDTTSITKSEVGTLISQYASERRRVQRSSSPNQSICLRGNVRGRVSNHQNPPIKTFTMREDYHDEVFVNAWHNDIMPELPNVLPTIIGLNYSATLVRKGETEQLSQAVIQIQCPKLPSVKVRNYIRSRILKPAMGKIPESSAIIEFLSGSLALLAGEPSLHLEEEEDCEYPYYRRFWSKPGMGAPIGLECTNQVSATLGCYIHVKGRLYILTVNHFIPASHKRLMSGAEPNLKLASPPQLEVGDARGIMEQFFRELDLETRQSMTEAAGKQNLGLKDVLSMPEDVSILLRKFEAVRKDLLMLEGGADNFALGTVEYQSTFPSVPQTVWDEVSQDRSKHHLDWALCSVVESREGLNRHRYQYNEETKEMDFFGEDVDMFGAGKLCVEIGQVLPGTKVHFVGQRNGLQHGTISPAKTLVSFNGVQTYEYTMVVDKTEHSGSLDFHGDSGASILQDSDNKLVGHLWGCVDDLLVFAPITAIFDDIRMKCGTKDVCLPSASQGPQPVPQPQPEAAIVELICRDATTESRRSRKVKSYKMQDPKKPYWTPGTSLAIQLEHKKLPVPHDIASLHGQDRKSSVLRDQACLRNQDKESLVRQDHASLHDQDKKLSLEYILAPEKRNTFPLNKFSKWDKVNVKHNGNSWLALNVGLDNEIMKVLKVHPRINFQNKLSLQYMLTPPRPEIFTRKHNTFPLYKQSRLTKLKRSGSPWSSHAPEAKAMSAISISG